jgi:hypothetical protein
VRRNELTALVEKRNERLVIRADRLREPSLRVDDRWPGPPVAPDELTRAIRRIGGVQAEVREPRMILGELRVGTRLAAAGQSPRRPDVDEHRPPAKLLERDVRAVERRARDIRRGFRRSRRRRRCRIGFTAAGRDRDQSECNHDHAHSWSVALADTESSLVQHRETASRLMR